MEIIKNDNGLHLHINNEVQRDLPALLKARHSTLCQLRSDIEAGNYSKYSNEELNTLIIRSINPDIESLSKMVS